ncbi:hypothetical protein [Terricaulis sp.]|uniref:hypothetical protein n=1 Tax=Terricaulis sp. TaxID=2768686 RepID=UPI003784D7B0
MLRIFVATFAFAVVAVCLPPRAHAAPDCLAGDNAELCAITRDTLADNPPFSQLGTETREAEAARQERHRLRRVRARALLDEISAPTWRDLYRAGYVISYGQTPEEDLLAHAIAIRALSFAPDEPDTHFLVAMTFDDIGRRYVGAQVYGRQKYFELGETGVVTRQCLPQMIDPPLPASVGISFHAPPEGFERCPPGVGVSPAR